MIIDALYTVNLSDFTQKFESGIVWKNVNNKIFALDYGINTDHVSTTIKIYGDISLIKPLHSYLKGKLTNEITVNLSNTELIFGPQYIYSSPLIVTLSNLGDIEYSTIDFVEFTCELYIRYDRLNFKYIPDTSLDLNNFCVKNIKRAYNSNINSITNMVNFSVINHTWDSPEFSIELNGTDEKIGAMLEFIITNRSTPININCNDSIMFIDSTSINVYCINYSGLKLLGNYNWWNVTLNFVRY